VVRLVTGDSLTRRSQRSLRVCWPRQVCKSTSKTENFLQFYGNYFKVFETMLLLK